MTGIETGIEQVVALAAGVPFPWNALVKRWDKILPYRGPGPAALRSVRPCPGPALRIRPWLPMAAVRAWE